MGGGCWSQINEVLHLYCYHVGEEPSSKIENEILNALCKAAAVQTNL